MQSSTVQTGAPPTEINADRQLRFRRDLQTHALPWKARGITRKGDIVNERFDTAVAQLAEGASRRKALLGVAALGLGSLGLAAFGDEAAAKSKCKKCKDKCHNKNQQRKNKNKQSCSNKCHNRCRNKNK